VATVGGPRFDPILDAIDHAPIGDPFTLEEEADLRRAVADIASGRTKPVAQKDVPAWFDEFHRFQRGGQW
jgi:hypothetical protein